MNKKEALFLTMANALIKYNSIFSIALCFLDHTFIGVSRKQFSFL